LVDWSAERERLAHALSDPLEQEEGRTRNGALAVGVRYRALVRNLPDTVVAVHDRDLRGVSIDGPAVSRTDEAALNFDGRTLHELLPADEYERLEPHYRAALNGESISTEFRYGKSGRYYSLEILPLREDGESPIEGVFTVARDITAWKQAEHEERQRTAEQSAVAALGVKALEGLPLEQLAEEAVSTVAQTLGVELCELLELSDDREVLNRRAGIGWDEGDDPVTLSSGYYAGFVWGSARPVVTSDYAGEKRFAATPALSRHGGVATLAVTIGSPHRRYGVLAAHSCSPREFSGHELSFLQGIANVVGEALVREAAENEMRHQALHDPLTGLPNRTLFVERLTQWLDGADRTSRTAAVMFVDVDHFKVVNDALGHVRGDQLLQAVARRLRAALRPTDTVARVGGDEFVVLCEDLESQDEAITVAKRLSGALDDPFKVADHTHRVTASVGIAVSKPNATVDELMRDADAAMYRAKEGGRARCQLFHAGMRAWAENWFTIEGELRSALERSELSNVYQPIVDPANGRIAGFEALVRWHHPERGTISPADFIPIAEQNGMIVEIGHQVLREACEEAMTWSPLPDGTPLRISVNLSPRQLGDPGLVDSVSAVLKVTELAPERLSLEITESAFADDPARALHVLRNLKKLGVSLELDDFGTGYSSLTYVRMFPIDALKIDRSFVQGVSNCPEDAAIVEAVISMGRALGVNVVAEGVESEDQSEVLQQLGCTLAQGFLFSRPVPASALPGLVARG
jgi:diguanylate cyclase (GGDEF)-like protein